LQIALINRFPCAHVVQILEQFFLNFRFDASIYPKWVFCTFHLTTKLNNFFAFEFYSVLQIALVNKTPYALVIQISE
jgi:hypothetical protein